MNFTLKANPILLTAIFCALIAQSGFGQTTIIPTGNVIINTGGTLNLSALTWLIADSGPFTMNPGGNIAWSLGGTGRFTGYSGIDVQGNVSLDPNSTVLLALINGYNPQAGDSFELFHFLGPVSAGSPQFSVPALDPSLTWNTSAFSKTGTVSVTPEPGSVALLLGGCALLAARRRRSA